MAASELPLPFVIRESAHRVHNPFTEEKLATLGIAAGSTRGIGVSTWDGACSPSWTADRRTPDAGRHRAVRPGSAPGPNGAVDHPTGSPAAAKP